MHESALLCRALLGQKLGTLQGLGKPARLMLADALLEMGDVRGAADAIGDLVRQRLSLAEVLKLLAIQLDHQSRTGAWNDMMSGLTGKVQLAELMPAPSAARAQALLALAAKNAGRQDWCDWLRRRAELLADVQRLAAERRCCGSCGSAPEVCLCSFRLSAPAYAAAAALGGRLCNRAAAGPSLIMALAAAGR